MMAKLSKSRLVFTSAYGARDPIKTAAGVTESFHYGVDYGPEVRNTPGIVLQAVIGGRASWLSDQYGALGVRITASATGDLLTLLRRLYGGVVEGARVTFDLWHLASRLVASGTDVAEGASVGVMGSTGRSTGIHTHAELRIGGKVVDPKPFIDAQASKAVAPAPDDYYGEEWLMALTEQEQRELHGWVKGIAHGMFVPGKQDQWFPSLNNKLDAIEKAGKETRDALTKPDANGFRPVDVILSHAVGAYAIVAKQAKAQGVVLDASALVAEMRKTLPKDVADELAKRLANG